MAYLKRIPTDKPLAGLADAVRDLDGDLRWPEGHYWWSGEGSLAAPPAVGAEIVVAMNRLGPGTVLGYFIEHGFLGVAVRLRTPPDWWTRQNGRHNPAALVFGAEVRGLGAEDV